MGLAAGAITQTRTALESMNFFCAQSVNLPCQGGKIRQRKHSERIMRLLPTAFLPGTGTVEMSWLCSPTPAQLMLPVDCHLGQCSFWEEDDMGSDHLSLWLVTALGITLLVLFFDICFIICPYTYLMHLLK